MNADDGSALNSSSVVRWERIKATMDVVVQLPTRIQMTFGGGPLSRARREIPRQLRRQLVREILIEEQLHAAGTVQSRRSLSAA